MKSLAQRVVTCLARRLRKTGRLDGLADTFFSTWYGLPMRPFHFYSPLPNLPTVTKNSGRWYRPGDFTHISMNLNEQQLFLAQAQRYSGESAAIPGFAQVMAEGYGEGYGEVEAHFLHSMIRLAKPRRMIEVGSGVSTYYALNALTMNKAQDEIAFCLDCIEPYPRQRLRTLAAQDRIRLHVSEVQDVGIDVFQELGAGDILFIDSSHVSKIDSDVNYLYLEVLPALGKGVIVHVHDIPFPYLTLPPEHALFRHSCFWNEAALLKAFLTFNSAFKVLVCQSFLHFHAPTLLKSVVPAYDPARHFPASIWLQKVL